MLDGPLAVSQGIPVEFCEDQFHPSVGRQFAVENPSEHTRRPTCVTPPNCEPHGVADDLTWVPSC